MSKNGYAALVKQRTEGTTKRRKLDDYETPPEPTRILLANVGFKGPVYEPAAGVGQRIVKELRDAGLKVTFGDIKTGQDFFDRKQIHKGDIITNPPYRDGLAERFARHALKLADGRVAMLMQSGFLWGSKRAAGLFEEFRPETVIILPDRIRFIVPQGMSGAGKPIDSQFFSHCWIVWPPRAKRDSKLAQQATTQLIWGADDSPF
jgi:hypothetical protein